MTKIRRTTVTALACSALLAAFAGAGFARSEFTEKERSWWAILPLGDREAPEVSDARWNANAIDRFIFSAQISRGLEPSAEASKEELARRVYLDITGLPPTPEELANFVENKKADAYERLVDRLLDSPRYGERWAQHWLDLVRYAESDGFRADTYRPDAWPYRDYVIRSFNADKPYDQFVREQLAGDEIDPGDPEVLVATGFLRHGIYEYNQRDIRAHWDVILNEVTDVTGDVFLGLSYQCARCHDHKFDPILQADYFRLKAFFTPLAWRDDIKLATAEEKAEYSRKRKNWEKSTKEIRAEMDAIVGGALDAKRKDALEKFPGDIQKMMVKAPLDRTPIEEQLARLAHRQIVFEEKRFKPDGLKGEVKERYEQLAAELAKFDQLKPKPLRPAFVATDVGGESSPTTYKGRSGDNEAEPGILTILDPDEIEIKAPADLPTTGRRLALANWITRPDNPLSTRVIVNRVWQMHFGRGLVATPSDFGQLGEKPSHPELLDWLARRFVEDGWSLKKLHRRIVTSATYRQTARREPGEKESLDDPENWMLWKFPPRRLDAGQARDALLLASGELEFKEGGPSLGGDARCRSVFVKKVRNTPDEFLRQFDGPAGFSSAPMRSSTTTPIQSLLLINSEWAVSRARAMAGRLLKEGGGDLTKVIKAAHLRLYGRQPSPVEIEEGKGFIAALETQVPKPEPKEEGEKGGADLVAIGSAFPGVAGTGSHAFPFDGKEQRLEVEGNPDEGDEFTVEAIVNLESLYSDASVRTVVSRWNGNAGRLLEQDKGWALGITSEKSRYEPRNLIVQLVGEDFQGNITYEVVASDLRIPVGKPYYIAAVISTLPTPGNKVGGTVTFFAQELGAKPGAIEVATVEHGISSSLQANRRKLIVGGRDEAGRSLFHGGVARVAITAGKAMEEGGIPFAVAGKKEGIDLTGKGGVLPDGVLWMRPSEGPSKFVSARQQAVVDYCHVLMNSNEFLYLH